MRYIEGKDEDWKQIENRPGFTSEAVSFIVLYCLISLQLAQPLQRGRQQLWRLVQQHRLEPL